MVPTALSIKQPAGDGREGGGRRAQQAGRHARDPRDRVRRVVHPAAPDQRRRKERGPVAHRDGCREQPAGAPVGGRRPQPGSVARRASAAVRGRGYDAPAGRTSARAPGWSSVAEGALGLQQVLGAQRDVLGISSRFVEARRARHALERSAVRWQAYDPFRFESYPFAHDRCYVPYVRDGEKTAPPTDWVHAGVKGCVGWWTRAALRPAGDPDAVRPTGKTISIR